MRQTAMLFIRPVLALVITMAIVTTMGGCSMAELWNLNTLMNWAGTQLGGLGL